MNNLPMIGTRNHLFPLAAVVVMGCGLLVAGLWPFPFFKANHARYDRAAGCLTCDPFASAYLPMNFKGTREPVVLDLRLAFKPQARYPYLASILTLYDVQTKTAAITIGQWGRELVVRVRSTSAATRRPLVAEQGVDSFFYAKDRAAIRVGIGRDHIRVSAGDRVLVFGGPILPDSAIITAGNSIQGDCPWTGVLCIGIDQHSGTATDSLAGRQTNAPALVIPRYFRPITATVLKPLWQDASATLWYVRDVVLNCLGFIPLGFLVTMLLYRRSFTVTVMTATGIGLCLSLAIELLQVFLPYRSSQMGDVIFNTLGTAYGALLCVIWRLRQPTVARSAGFRFF